MPPPVPVYFQSELPVSAAPAEVRHADNSPPSSSSQRPRSRPLPTPRLRFQIVDLTHGGASKFLASMNPLNVLQQAIVHVLELLYPDSSLWQEVRSVTLILDPMDGVAYTTGIELDEAHKEIHLSMSYVRNIGEDRLDKEIAGVIVHEMVHCWQRNGRGTAPGGLIEGIADWVRLNAGYSPPHWSRETHGNWDAGYQHTAYFLDWLETNDKLGGKGSVVKINQTLNHRYDEKSFWPELFGKSVHELWEAYKDDVSKHQV